MKHILPTNNIKQILFLTLKHTLFLNKLAMIILLSAVSLFAAEEERKEAEQKKYNDALTQQLAPLSMKANLTQEEIDQMVTLINNGANPNQLKLHYLCVKNCIPLIEAYATHGGCTEKIDFDAGVDILFRAISIEAVRLLVNAGANIMAKKITSNGNALTSYWNTDIGIGAIPLHCASKFRSPPEIVELYCNRIPADQIPLDDAGLTPLHYACQRLCKKDVQEKPDLLNATLQKTAIVTWWNLNQLTVRGAKENQTPRDIVEQKAPGMLHFLDAIIRETQEAQAELSPLPFTPPMLFAPSRSLREFDLDREKIEKQELYAIIPEQLKTPGIPELIGNFAGQDTPQPKYQALTFRNNWPH